MQVSNLGMANLCQTENTGKVIKEYGIDYDVTFSVQAAAFGTYLVMNMKTMQYKKLLI